MRWRRALTGKAQLGGEPSPQLESLKGSRAKVLSKSPETEGETGGGHGRSTRLRAAEPKKAREATRSRPELSRLRDPAESYMRTSQRGRGGSAALAPPRERRHMRRRRTRRKGLLNTSRTKKKRDSLEQGPSPHTTKNRTSSVHPTITKCHGF